jgi:hypothetical protein
MLYLLGKNILYPFNTFCKYFCDLLRMLVTIKPFARHWVATFTSKFGHLNETLVLDFIDGFLNKPRYIMIKKHTWIGLEWLID